jgi:basic membrane protein A
VKKGIVALALSGAIALGGLSATAVGGQSAHATSDLKVGLVTDIGGLNDRSFNFLANKGLEDAKAKYGVQTTVLQSQSAADYIPNIQRLIAQGNTMILTIGFLMGDATGQMARENPDVSFAIVDFSATDKAIGGAKNVKGLLFKEQEAGYLAGYLAGLFQQTKAKGINAKNVIGSVGGQKIPPVDRYIAGYRAGAKKADPKVTVLNGYSNNFVQSAPCAEQTLAQIGKGADIEFQVAGQCGLGTLSTAKDRKIWGIGVDADQAYLGSHILTSALKRVDVAVSNAIGDKVANKFAGGNDRVFSLKDNGVGLGKINKAVSKSIVSKVNQQKAQIIAGKVRIPANV